MSKTMYLWIGLALMSILAGCAITPTATMANSYPRMYERKPISILILPPINNSTAADAKEYFSCSLGEALGLVGYYPLPVEPVFSILREEGMYDTETVTPVVLSNLKKYFGADAVLISSIEKWDKSWFLTSGTLTIDAKFSLLSTDNAEIIWDYHTITKVKLGSSSDNIFMSMVESAIKTAVEDYFPNARRANIYTFERTIPYGKYHPGYNTDGERTVHENKVGVFEINK